MKVNEWNHKHSMTGVPSTQTGDEMKTAQEMADYLYKFYTLQEIADMAGLSQTTIYNAKTGYPVSNNTEETIRQIYDREYKKRETGYLTTYVISPPAVGFIDFTKPVKKLTPHQNELISERLVKETEGIRSPDSAYLEKIRLALTDQFQALNGNTDFQDDTRQ